MTLMIEIRTQVVQVSDLEFIQCFCQYPHGRQLSVQTSRQTEARLLTVRFDVRDVLGQGTLNVASRL